MLPTDRSVRTAIPAEVPLADAVGELKLVDPGLYHGVAEVFFH